MSGKVYIVDDDRAVRDALAALLETAGFDCERHASARSFLDGCDGHDGAACTLMDMRMPDMDGLECQLAMLERGIDIPVIFLTGHADVPSAVEAMKLGAVDFLEKPVTDADELITRVSESLERHAAERRAARDRLAAVALLETLTPREREIVDLISQGRANKVMAADLGISERTIEVHRGHAFQKLGIRHVAELMRLLEIAES